jgi:response regulator RpfG family c-di-GMP phosphodiesterase
MENLPVALVVDDKYTNIILIKTILRKFKIEKAYSVDTAIKILKTTRIDIIISDYNMPEKNGQDLLNWVNKSTLDIPFVFVSAVHDPELIKDLKQKGADDYITKPFSVKLLQNKIIAILQTRNNSIY